jgi:hypothetical protein
MSPSLRSSINLADMRSSSSAIVVGFKFFAIFLSVEISIWLKEPWSYSNYKYKKLAT